MYIIQQAMRKMSSLLGRGRVVSMGNFAGCARSALTFVEEVCGGLGDGVGGAAGAFAGGCRGGWLGQIQLVEVAQATPGGLGADMQEGGHFDGCARPVGQPEQSLIGVRIKLRLAATVASVGEVRHGVKGLALRRR